MSKSDAELSQKYEDCKKLAQDLNMKLIIDSAEDFFLYNMRDIYIMDFVKIDEVFIYLSALKDYDRVIQKINKGLLDD